MCAAAAGKAAALLGGGAAGSSVSTGAVVAVGTVAVGVIVANEIADSDSVETTSGSGESSGEGRSGPRTLEPGPHAGESIPARGPGRDFTPGEREQVNEIGRETGCHTCGTTDPGTKSGNFVPDHQPPSATNTDGSPQRLYPQCLNCSRTQGGEVRQLRPPSDR